MTKLDEILELLEDSKSSLADALLKTKSLLRSFRTLPHLTDWISHELTGYPEDAKTPDYRVISCETYGVVDTTVREPRFLMPLHHLPKAQRDLLQVFPVISSIYIIEQDCRDYRAHFSERTSGGKAGPLRRTLPIELVQWFQPQIKYGHVVKVWGEPNIGEFEAITVAVRSRLQDFLLDVRDEVGSVDDDSQLQEKVKQVNIPQLFEKNVFHGANIFIQPQAANLTITTYAPIISLNQELKAAGMDDEDLKELDAALAEDSLKGQVDVETGNTGQWFKDKAKEIGSAALKVGTNLTLEWIKMKVKEKLGLPPTSG